MSRVPALRRKALKELAVLVSGPFLPSGNGEHDEVGEFTCRCKVRFRQVPLHPDIVNFIDLICDG
jgi:hypothetical protein